MLKHRDRFASWLPALFDGEFDWDFLLPCWKDTKIQPMDFDAVVERRGHFLVFETKIAGKHMDLGQAISLTAAWKNGSTIIQLEGKQPGQISAYQMYKENDKSKTGKVGDRELIKGDSFDVIYMTRCWFCWASNIKIPNRKEWDNQLWQWDYERMESK